MRRILVVDDDFVSRKLMVEMLKTSAECDTAANGTEAIEAYNYSIRNNAPYDLIILDISMPGMNGIEVLKKIRENEEKARVMVGEGIPIVVVTAYHETFLDAFNKGCDDYMLKPIKKDDLIAKIDSKLRNTR